MAISFAQLRVLHPSRIARRLLWHVLSIGTVSRDEPEEHAGMDKAGLFLFRVKSGRGAVELPHERYELKPGSSWWLLDLARPRRYVPHPGTRLVTMGVRFSDPGIDTWRDEALRGRAGILLASPQHSAQLHKASGELMRLAAASPSGAEWRMHEILTSVLGVLLQAQDMLNMREPEPHSPTRRIIEAVQANPLRALAVLARDLAESAWPRQPAFSYAPGHAAMCVAQRRTPPSVASPATPSFQEEP